MLGSGSALALLRTWTSEDFEGGCYAERLKLMRGGYKGDPEVE